MKYKLRYLIFFSCLAAFALYILIHYFALMVRGIDPPPVRQAEIEIERGSILDRNGRFLALQLRFADVSVWRPSISDINVLADELEPIIEIPASEIIQRINSSASNFLYLKRQVDDATARRLSAILAEKRITGVMVQPIVGRLYPERNLASQAIGFTGDRNRGLEGIEFAYNNLLNGIDNDGKGSHIVLTIDVNVQYMLEQIAAQTMSDTGAEAIMFLAMDPRTGDILGSASLPNFDLNNVRASDAVSRMNRPAIWAYEPGSVFKVYSIAALMDAGAISADTAYNCTGVYLPRRGSQITCLNAHGRVTAREIIIHSCNIGAASASENISNSQFYDWLNNFGFGTRTGAGSPGETAGYLVQSSLWSDRSKPTIAFGQEIAVSAFQMLKAATAIANDGVLVPPRLILQTVSPDGIVTPWVNGERRQILSAETARAMRSYMVDTTFGMGWRAAVEDLALAVKTGTAQMIDPSTNRYSETDYIASCIAIFPAESPSLILYLAIIKPQSNIFGATIAAPAIREAAGALIDYFGIPRGRNPQIYHPPAINIPASRLPAVGEQMPDLSGIAKRILVPLLLRDDINVEIHGDGWVVNQYPPAGTPVTDGMSIILELE